MSSPLYLRGRSRAEALAALAAKPWRRVVSSRALPWGLAHVDTLECGHTEPREHHRNRPEAPKRRRCTACAPARPL